MKKSIVLVFLLLLSVHVAAAVEIESTTFFVGDEELNYIVLGKAQLSRIQFSFVTDQELLGVSADFTSINPDPNKRAEYSGYQLSANCDEEATFVNATDEETGEVTTTKEVSGYVCEARSIVFRPTSASVEIPVQVQTADGTQTLSAPVSFALDRTRPVMEKIETGYCDDVQCYIGSGGVTEFFFYVSDEESGFEQERIYYTFNDGSIRQIDQCENNRCSGITIVECENGATQRLNLANLGDLVSGDDAGNQFTGETDVSFVCDAQMPGQVINPISNEVLTIEVRHPNYPFPNPKNGDSITISAVIHDSISPIKAKANFTGLISNEQYLDASCIPVRDNPALAGFYNCSWVVANVQAGFHDVEFYMRDTANNERVFTKQVIVDQFDDTGDETTPIFFGPTDGTLSSPAGFNRVAMQLAYDNNILYPISATYQMNKVVGNDIDLFFTQIDEFRCMIKANATSEVPASGEIRIWIDDPFLNYRDENNQLLTNRVNFAFNQRSPDEFPDEFAIDCEVDAYVREGSGRIYPEPTTFELRIDMKLRNSALGNAMPGQHYADKIVKQELRLDNWEIIGKASRLLQTFSTICGLNTVVNTVRSAGVGLNVAGSVGEKIPLIGPAFTPLKVTGKGIQDGANVLNTDEDIFNLDVSPVQDLLSKSCSFVRCDLPFNAAAEDANPLLNGNIGLDKFLSDAGISTPPLQEKAYQSYTNVNIKEWQDLDKIRDYEPGQAIPDRESVPIVKFDGAGAVNDLNNEVFGGISVADPSDSIIMASMMLCLPAVIQNLEEARQIECSHLLCMKESSKRGLDISVCEQTRNELYCKEVVGEFFEMPFLREVTNIADNINDLAANAAPVILKTVGANLLCRQDLIAKIGPENLDPAYNDLILYACGLPRAIGEALHLANMMKGSPQQYVFQGQYDYCPAARCNGDNCPRLPQYLQPLEQFTIPILGLPANFVAGGEPVTPEGFRQLIDNARSGDIDALEQLSRYEGVDRSRLIDSGGNPLEARDREAGYQLYLNELEANLNKGIADAQANGQNPGQMKVQGLIPETSFFQLVDVGQGESQSSYETDLRTYRTIQDTIADDASAWDIHYAVYTTQSEEYLNLLERRNALEAQGPRSSNPTDTNNYFAELEELEQRSNEALRLMTAAQENDLTIGEVQLLIDTGEIDARMQSQLNAQIGEGQSADPNEFIKVYTNEDGEIVGADASDAMVVDTQNLPSNHPLRDSAKQVDTATEIIGPDGTSGSLNTDRSKLVSAIDEDIENLNAELEKVKDGEIGDTGYSNAEYEAALDYLRNKRTCILEGATCQVREDREREIKAFEQQRDERRQEIDAGLSVLARYAVQNNWFNINRLADIGGGKWQGKVDDVLNTNNWAGGVCRMTVSQEGTDGGNAIQCTDNFCTPVLTQSSEKVSFNSTHKLYTIVYFIGDVLEGTNNIEYTVVFKDGSFVHDLFEEDWQVLPLGEDHNFKQSIPLEGDYDTICIRFKEQFPPSGPRQRTEFCREIADVDEGDSGFDTGAPVSATYIQNALDRARGLSEEDANNPQGTAFTINFNG